MTHPLHLKNGLQKLKAIAKHRGGKCLSTTYEGLFAHYRFRCEHGHEWDGLGSNVLTQNTWCPTCHRQDFMTLEIAHETAKKRGGVCLSTTYDGWDHKLEWQCAQGHVWKAIGNMVRKGAWCRICANIKKSQDYTDPHGLARIREAAAKRGGHCLDQEYTGLNSIYRFCCAVGHEWRTTGHSVVNRGSWCRKCNTVERAAKLLSHDGLDRLKEKAAIHGGECLSSVYTGCMDRYQFRCKNRHVWDALGTRILAGEWCGACSRNRQLAKYRAQGMARLQKIVNDNGGVLHSQEYINETQVYSFECHKGHFWQTRGYSIFRGSWCPECAHADRITNRKSATRMRYQAANLHKT